MYIHTYNTLTFWDGKLFYCLLLSCSRNAFKACWPVNSATRKECSTHVIVNDVERGERGREGGRQRENIDWNICYLIGA